MARPLTLKMKCMSCSMPITLHLIGGQYQNSYQGDCDHCNEYWLLCSGEDDESGIPRHKHTGEKPTHALGCPKCGHDDLFEAKIGGHTPTFSIEDIDLEDPEHFLSKDVEIDKVICGGCRHEGQFGDFYIPVPKEK